MKPPLGDRRRIDEPFPGSMTLPFIYRDGTMTAITDWTGDARGINDAGQVTGGATPPGEMMRHAFCLQVLSAGSTAAPKRREFVLHDRGLTCAL